GLATEAVRLALEFGFTQLKLNRIFAWTFEKNVGSKKVLEKCGLKPEKVLNDANIRRAEKHNRLNYRILKSEYKLSVQKS
ncbi:MAG: GNAT family N-acetyltransferase, partial [Planctomycetota bacterium]